jgi:NADPH:quinone reductase-like Zn-dependent oxidoreductase
MAGRIEAVGKGVTLFKAGDEVYGDIYSSETGAWAEYICVPESGSFVKKPSNMTFGQAAAVPIAGLTALQALRDHGKIEAGQKVLVNGASGGVGTFCVILAKAFGTEITGVCSTRNLELVRSIGADHVIDYKKQDFTQLGNRYDLIIDVAGNLTPEGYRRLLEPQGTGVLVGYSSMMHMVKIMREGKKTPEGGVRIFAMGIAKANKKDFDVLREMMEAGRVTPAIDRVYPLEQTAEAMRYFEEEHARAKVVISVCEKECK